MITQVFKQTQTDGALQDACIVIRDATAQDIADITGIINRIASRHERIKEGVQILLQHRFFSDTTNTNTIYRRDGEGERIAIHAIRAVHGNAPCADRIIVLNKHVPRIDGETQAHAYSLIDKLARVYDNLPQQIFKRAKRAHYLSALVYVLAQHDYSEQDMRMLTRYIFEKRVALMAYADVMDGTSADRVAERVTLLRTLIDTRAWSTPDPRKYALFVRTLDDKGTICGRMDGRINVEYDTLTDNDLLRLYYANLDSDCTEWDSALCAVSKR